MRRQPDLEREILLAIEHHEGQSTPDLSGIKTTQDALGYHLTLLSEAGFIKATSAATLDDRYAMTPLRLTFRGHEYLDAIRDGAVWDQTKKVTEEVGSFSLDLLNALAKGLVKEKIRKHTGMEISL